MNTEEKLRQLSSIKLDPKILPPPQEGSEPASGWVVLEILGWIWDGIEVLFAILGAFFHH
ncbi:MAG: hypothetical protein JWO82_3876 [Akkermansiaceae bacterium]|nr:hypothetical protein [Akkermansiaceae bacterium]